MGIATTPYPHGLVLQTSLVFIHDGEELDCIGTGPKSSSIGVEKRH